MMIRHLANIRGVTINAFACSLLLLDIDIGIIIGIMPQYILEMNNEIDYSDYAVEFSGEDLMSSVKTSQRAFDSNSVASLNGCEIKTSGSGNKFISLDFVSITNKDNGIYDAFRTSNVEEVLKSRDRIRYLFKHSGNVEALAKLKATSFKYYALIDAEGNPTLTPNVTTFLTRVNDDGTKEKVNPVTGETLTSWLKSMTAKGITHFSNENKEDNSVVFTLAITPKAFQERICNQMFELLKELDGCHYKIESTVKDNGYINVRSYSKA